MGTLELEELRRRKKEQTIKLVEVDDATRQIAEAVERGDTVAVQMLLGEREAPLIAIREIEEGIRAYLPTLPEEEAIRMNALLRGAEPETEEEKPLAEQGTQFHRLLESVTAMDKRMSLRLGGNKSFYKMFRE